MNIVSHYLKALPAKRLDLLNGSSHVFVKIVAIYDRVDLELDIIFFAELTQSCDVLQMISLATANFDVGTFIERIAGDGNDVDELSISLEEAFGNFAAISHNGDGFDAEFGFAIFRQLSHHLWI